MILIVTLKATLDRVITVPELHRGRVNRAEQAASQAGGKGLNVARALFALGRRDGLCLSVVGGTTGEQMRALLEADGIRTDLVPSRAPSGVDVILREQGSGLETAIYEPGQSLQPDEVEELQRRFDRHLQGAALCVLAGRSPSPAADGFFAWAVDQARGLGLRSILDTSGRALELALPAGPTMVKVNADEAGDLLARSLTTLADRLAAAAAMVERGAGVAIITAGAAEVAVAEPARRWVVRPPAVQARRSVGCGDAMTAGLAHGLAEGRSFEDSLRLGVACGAARALTGPLGMLRSNEIGRLLAEVTLAPRVEA